MTIQKDGRPPADQRQGAFAGALVFNGLKQTQGTSQRSNVQGLVADQERSRRRDARAIEIARTLNLADAKRALLALDPVERQAFRTNAALFGAVVRSLSAEVSR